MQVAPQIAAFAAYRQPLADVLLRVKLCHWDCAVRILAAEAAAQLVPLDPGFWARTAVPELLAAALDSNLEVAAVSWHDGCPCERGVGGTLCKCAYGWQPLESLRAVLQPTPACYRSCIMKY